MSGDGDQVTGLSAARRDHYMKLAGIATEGALGALSQAVREYDAALAASEARATALLEALETAEVLARRVREKQSNALLRMRKHGFVFRRAPSDAVQHPETLSDGERWEHFAFALYTDIAEITQLAIQYIESRVVIYLMPDGATHGNGVTSPRTSGDHASFGSAERP